MCHIAPKVFFSLLCSFTILFVIDAHQVNAASFQVSWTDNSQDEDGFSIERKLDPNGTYEVIATVGPNVTFYSDSSLANSTTYCYRVNAFNSAGNSAYTNEVCGTPSGITPLPTSPGNTITTNVADGAVLSGSAVIWTATPSDSRVRVEIFIDGKHIRTEVIGPHDFNDSEPSVTLDTTKLTNGSHQLTVRAIYSDHSIAEQTVAVIVENNLTSLVLTQLAGGTNGVVTMAASKAGTATFQIALQPIAKIGIFRPETGEWFLDRNGNGQWDGCAVDICISSFGQPGDLPVTRKVSGVNGTIIGVFQPAHELWHFDINGNHAFDGCSIDECTNEFGTLGDIPVVGDWVGLGTEAIGVFRPNTGQWFLDANDNGRWDGCAVEFCLLQPFGDDGTLPVVGDWSGGGAARPGFFRPSTGEWVLDMNGNGHFDGCAIDACLGPFGYAGDLPVVGKW